MPFSYEQIEDEVVNRLQTTLAPYAFAVALPDVQKGVDDAIKASESANKALVVVFYDGSGFEGSNTTNQASQKDNIDIVCNVRATKRRGTNGVMNMLQLIKISLQGFKLATANRLFLKDIKLEEHDFDSGIFSYNITFTASKMQVQAFLDGDDDTTGKAILHQVHWHEKSFNGEETGGDYNPADFDNNEFNT